MRARRWPRPLGREAYDRARRRYVERLVATGQVRSVYQMGGVGAPGLSDLDLFVVLHDSEVHAVDLDAAADIRAGGDEERYVLMHGQFFLNADLFARLETVFFGSDLRHVFGERIDQVTLPAAEARALRLVFNLEMILSALVRLVRVLPDDAPLPVRPTIAVLNGVRFNVALAREWAATERGERYVAAVDALRADWFGFEREEAWARLAHLTREAVVVLDELIDRLAPAAAELCGGATLAGTVRALEVHEIHRFGPWPFSYHLRANPLGAAVPGRLRRSPRLAPHLGPLLELRLPAAYFGFFALEAAEFAHLGATGLARRVAGPLPPRPRPELVAALRKRAATIVDLHRFVARRRLRGASYPIPLAWQRPLPWKHRVKAKLLRALGS